MNVKGLLLGALLVPTLAQADDLSFSEHFSRKDILKEVGHQVLIMRDPIRSMGKRPGTLFNQDEGSLDTRAALQHAAMTLIMPAGPMRDKWEAMNMDLKVDRNRVMFTIRIPLTSKPY